VIYFPDLRQEPDRDWIPSGRHLRIPEFQNHAGKTFQLAGLQVVHRQLFRQPGHGGGSQGKRLTCLTHLTCLTCLT
jgi:hypothetical protein